MKAEIKENWLKALRSGEYKQGKGALRKNETYCCLGVLCDLYMKEHPNAAWVTKYKIDVEETFNFTTDKASKSDVLPTEVMDWSGLDHTNPDTKLGAVAQLNDKGYTFEDLANVIETEL